MLKGVQWLMWSTETPEMSESQKGQLELSIVGDARILRNLASDLVPSMSLSCAMSHSLGHDNIYLDKARILVC